MPVNYNSHLNYVTTSKRKKVAGIAFPLSNTGTGGIFTANEGIKSIRDGIIQMLLTSRGERVMRPDYGGNLRTSVFEQNDPLLAEALKSNISENISVYEPRVVVKALEVTQKDNELKILIKMSLKDDLLRSETLEIII